MQHSKSLYEKGILKNRGMLTQSQYADFKFAARMDHTKAFYAGIKALCFGDYGTFQINQEGMRVTVEHVKSVQACLFITSPYFSDYHVDESVGFSVKLNVLADCMSLFAGVECSMKMLYKGDGAPLIIMLEQYNDEDITTECSIRTSPEEQIMEFDLDEKSASLNVVFVRGPDFLNIFNELDKAAEELQITISPRKPHFKIESVGVMQAESSVEVANTSDMMMLFKCRDTTIARYKNQLLRLAHKALLSASKVALKTDASGLLELHFLMQADEREEIFVQFFLTPLADVE